MKQINLLLLTLCLSFAGAVIAPAYVFAQSIFYDVWCSGERFSSDNTTLACGGGTAVCDPATSTLTLTNATIDKGCAIPDYIIYTYV